MSKLETTVEATEELVDLTPVENTPFTMVKADDKYFLAMGNYKLTPPMEKDDCEDKANIITWDMIMNVIQIMIETNKKLENGTDNRR